MFAYCLNNPVNGYDSTGHVGKKFQQKQLEGAAGGAVIPIGLGLLLVHLLMSAKETVEELVQGLQQIKISVFPPEGEYTVYFLCDINDSNGSIIYVGRVKTKNYKARMDYHERMGRECVKTISNLSYELCRAIEQGGMMYYHTINRDAALNNKIRGISPSNQKRHIYFALMIEIVNRNIYPDNSVLPLSYWQNLTENEFLNIEP